MTPPTAATDQKDDHEDPNDSENARESQVSGVRVDAVVQLSAHTPAE